MRTSSNAIGGSRSTDPHIHLAPVASCRYCGCDDLEPLYAGVEDRLGRAGGSWSFRKCTRCGSAILDPAPVEEELDSLYPEGYSFSVEHESDTTPLQRWMQRAQYRLIYRPMYTADANRLARITGIGNANGRRLLDVGCGRGMRLAEFSRHGYDATGIDFNGADVEYVRTELGLTASTIGLAELTSHFAAESFDVITAYYVLEHLSAPRQVLQSCFELLRPGGWIALAVPLFDSAQSGLFGARWTQVTEAPRHLTVPTQQASRELCEQAGFVDVGVVPDSHRIAAASFALSCLSRATSHHAGKRASIVTTCIRAAAVVLSTAVLPWCWFESSVLGRPAVGLVVGRKPA